MPVPNNPFQNPFYNRFNDPVTRRADDMDTYAWLRNQQRTRSPNAESVDNVLRNCSDSSNLCHPSETKEQSNEGHRLVDSAV